MATIPPTILLTESETAERFKITPRCLQDWRRTQSGPPWIRVGRRVRYRLQDLEAWMLGQRQESGGISPDQLG